MITIEYVHHPALGAIWYGAAFVYSGNRPYLIDASYPCLPHHAKDPHGAKIPEHVREILERRINIRASQMGVRLQQYPEMDRPRQPRTLPMATAIWAAPERAILDRINDASKEAERVLRQQIKDAWEYRQKKTPLDPGAGSA